jgi:hypothetical protein
MKRRGGMKRGERNWRERERKKGMREEKNKHVPGFGSGVLAVTEQDGLRLLLLPPSLLSSLLFLSLFFFFSFSVFQEFTFLFRRFVGLLKKGVRTVKKSQW